MLNPKLTLLKENLNFMLARSRHFSKQVRYKLAIIIKGREAEHLGLNLVTYKLTAKKRISKPKYNLAIVTMTLNAEDYIEEWIDFHISQGVEHFYIYDQLSTDSTHAKLYKYIEKDLVTFIMWPNVFGMGSQVLLYAHAISAFWSECRWMSLTDLDEFLYPTDSETVADSLVSLDDYSAIYLHWKSFGPSGHLKKPNGYVIRNYTHMANFPESISENSKQSRIGTLKYDLTRIKAIVDPSKVTLIKVHGCKVEGEVKDNPENLNLNHYITLSQEEFQKKIKRTLGEHTWGNIEHSNNWAEKRRKQYEFLIENYVVNKDILKFDKLK
jgi:hypothetical protein